MCVIVDTSVVGLMFSEPQKGFVAATVLRKYIDNGKLNLVVGGKLKKELFGTSKFRKWYLESIKSGTSKSISDFKVKKEKKKLKPRDDYKSNDLHVLALARVSGARLLNTDDDDLMADFKNRDLIPGKPGKVFLTKSQVQFTKAKRKLLDNATCRT